MMNFRTIKTNLIAILAAAVATGGDYAGKFDVLQAQKQKQGDQDINNLPKVFVYYSKSDFSKNTSSANDASQSTVTYNIVCEVAEKGTYTDIDDPSSLTSAEIIADSKIDELFEIVYQIIMHGDNLDLGMTVGQVAERFIDSIEKGQISKDGELAVLTGTLNLTVKTVETVGTTDETDGTNVNSSITVSDASGNTDTVAKTEITVDPNV